MSTTPDHDKTPATAQRDALGESEKKAAEPQPGSFKDAENADKIVEVPPIDADSLPIQGLDPDR